MTKEDPSKNNAIVLYSGGKDSSLVARTLDQWGYDVQLMTINFGIVPDSWKTSAKSAEILGFPHKVIQMPPEVVEQAADLCEKDGHARGAITFVHISVLEHVATEFGKDYKVIADGARRDDRTPIVPYSKKQSIEMRHGVELVSLLWGVCYKTIKYITDNLFSLKTIIAGKEITSEYEMEIRAVLRKRGGTDLEWKIFPPTHEHTILTGLKY